MSDTATRWIQTNFASHETACDFCDLDPDMCQTENEHLLDTMDQAHRDASGVVRRLYDGMGCGVESEMSLSTDDLMDHAGHMFGRIYFTEDGECAVVLDWHDGTIESWQTLRSL